MVLEFPHPRSDEFSRDPSWNRELSPKLIDSAVRRLGMEETASAEEIKNQSTADVQLLERIMERLNGQWPSMDLVGFAAAFAAFAIAYHADHAPLFQARMLEKMREKSTNHPHFGTVYPPALALMEDKVADILGRERPYQVNLSAEDVSSDLLEKRMGMGMGRNINVLYPPEFGNSHVFFKNYDLAENQTANLTPPVPEELANTA